MDEIPTVVVDPLPPDLAAVAAVGARGCAGPVSSIECFIAALSESPPPPRPPPPLGGTNSAPPSQRLDQC